MTANYTAAFRYLESKEQTALFRRMSLKKYRAGTVRDYCYAVPNAGTAGGRRAMLAGVRRKAEGVTAGVSDIECLVAVAPHTGWHCEMKQRGGVPSDVSAAQRNFIALATSCGRKCDIGYGEQDAWEKLCAYLKIKP